MTGFLLPALELMVILPGMLLAYLPMKGYLRPTKPSYRLC